MKNKLINIAMLGLISASGIIAASPALAHDGGGNGGRNSNSGREQNNLTETQSNSNIILPRLDNRGPGNQNDINDLINVNGNLTVRDNRDNDNDNDVASSTVNGAQILDDNDNGGLENNLNINNDLDLNPSNSSAFNSAFLQARADYLAAVNAALKAFQAAVLNARTLFGS